MDQIAQLLVLQFNDKMNLQINITDLIRTGKETTMEQTRRLINAKEVAEVLSISSSYAYKVIDQLNKELQKAGYLTIPGKVDALYLQKRYFPAEEKILTC